MRIGYYVVIFGLWIFLGACSSTKKKEAPAPVTPTPAMAVPPKPVEKTEPKKNEELQTNVTCKNSQDSRILEIQVLSKGCKLWYSKLGNKNEIASSAYGIKHCDQVRSKVVSNLKAGGFECMTLGD